MRSAWCVQLAGSSCNICLGCYSCTSAFSVSFAAFANSVAASSCSWLAPLMLLFEVSWDALRACWYAWIGDVSTV